MAEGDARNNNQRVTNARIQMSIENMDKKLDVLPKMQKQLHDIDTQLQVVCKDVERNKEDIDDLQAKSNRNDTIIGAFTVVGTVFASTVNSLFGGRQ